MSHLEDYEDHDRDPVGWSSPRRKHYWESLKTDNEVELLPLSKHNSLVDSLGSYHLKRSAWRCRPSHVVAALKRVILLSPVAILSLFGVLHLLQVLIGRSHLFWDADTTYRYPAAHQTNSKWSTPGTEQIPPGGTRDVLPVQCHSHNDYWRAAPLFDAIHWGCTSVEADVWLFDDQLYVGHNVRGLARGRTLESLYIDPLVDLLDGINPSNEISGSAEPFNGVFETAPEQTLVLLVDLKNDNHNALRLLQSQLQPLRERGFLTHWDGTSVVPGAVTVVGTGSTPFGILVQNSTYRDIFFDAPLNKFWDTPRKPIDHEDAIHQLDGLIDYGQAMSISTDDAVDSIDGSQNPNYLLTAQDFNTSNSYYASVSFKSAVGHVWRGHLSARQMEIIRGQIRGAKRKNLKVRYWSTPSWPVSLRNHVWHVLVKEGADVLNVDDLTAAIGETWTDRVHRLWG